MTERAEILVIGAGMAGASLAAHLAESHRVCLLEMEERPAYHTTGRSAAIYEPNYGPPLIQALTRVSKRMFDNPPEGFADGPLLTARSTMFLSIRGQQDEEAKFHAEAQSVEEIALEEAIALVPVLRASAIAAAFIDRASADIDVDRLHQAYLRKMKRSNGRLVTNAEVTRLEYQNGNWRCSTSAGEFTAPIVVNAAGAWGDVIAVRAGLAPIGLVPKRRSAALVPVPQGLEVRNWPVVCDIAETLYFKPTSGVLMVSPAEATPVEPHDASADDMALAEGIDRFQNCTTLEVKRLQYTWAGLRTFSPDGVPVAGFDPRVHGFFWCVGQGGYGIQTAPALALLAAALVREEAVSPVFDQVDFDPLALSPRRFGL